MFDDGVYRVGYSNRIFYLTDLEVGQEDARKFKDSVQANSSKNLWSTVVGVGLDLTQVSILLWMEKGLGFHSLHTHVY